MGMLCAWSILNKVAARGDARFSDVVLVVCPNLTIRDRLRRARSQQWRGVDLPYARSRPAPPDAEPAAGSGAREELARVRAQGHERRREGAESRSSGGGEGDDQDRREDDVWPRRPLHDREGARDRRRSTECRILEDRRPNKAEVVVEETRYVESDAKLMQRLLGSEVGGKQNILVLNDEAHHAYRIRGKERRGRNRGRGSARSKSCRTSWRTSRQSGSTASTASTAPQDQLLRRPVRHPVLPRAGGRGDEQDFPMGRQRLRPHRRDRVRPRQDSAARALRSVRGGRRLSTSTSGAGS